jgi:hypothetical protein
VPKTLLQIAASTVGAVLGGILGYAAFFWVTRHGFYALALPGIFLGLGCGALSFGKSRVRGAVCGIVGLLLCIYTEWKFVDPDATKTSFIELAVHFPNQGTVTMILAAVGAIAAFWFGSDGLMQAWWPGGGKNGRDAERPRD